MHVRCSRRGALDPASLHRLRAVAHRSDGPRREHPGPPVSPDEFQPQELVVTFFGAYVREKSPAPVWSGGLVELLAEFGFSAAAARIALARVVDRGLLERHRDG